LLTKVTPNSPAALADLRAGDIIVRVNNGEVKNTEDFSYLLNEAGGGASVQFTVLRAETAPREVTIKLSEALNLRRATEMDMASAQAYTGLSGANSSPAAVAARQRVLEASEIDAARARARGGMAEATTRYAGLLAGLDYIILPTGKAAGGQSAATMMLVNLVRPGSSAEKLGLRAGDLILSVNGQKLSGSEWAEKLLLRNVAELSLEVMRGRQRITLKMQ
jgi:S1-C subfamily serine protease